MMLLHILVRRLGQTVVAEFHTVLCTYVDLSPAASLDGRATILLCSNQERIKVLLHSLVVDNTFKFGACTIQHTRASFYGRRHLRYVDRKKSNVFFMLTSC
jgi:hypothetical protein